MGGWFRSLRNRLARSSGDIPDPLWSATLQRYPFLLRHGAGSAAQLRLMSQQFLADKEFHGASGLQIDDTIAVAIAAQACLPVLAIQQPHLGTQWYNDFVGIVVYPGAVRARRETVDDDGIVHQYHEELTGEAMQDGPVTLSWEDVAAAGDSAVDGYNVVIHEFVHKLDMRDGVANGCPPLAAGFMGAPSAGASRRLWLGSLQRSYENFCDRLSLAQRFGGAPVWLDPYAARSIDEFFAVASEAYFVNPQRFALEFADVVPLFDAFFRAPTA
jgi:Mlc titration factor MtfA (ptsG expression regulator)